MSLFHNRKHQSEELDHVCEGPSCGFFFGLIALPKGIESPFYHDLELFSELKSRAINFDVKENSTSNYIFLRTIKIESAKIILATLIPEAFNAI